MTRPPTDTSESTDVRYERIVEGVRDYAIFMLDPDGCVVTWNTGARLIKGYEEHEILGRSFTTFYPPEQVARGWPERELELAREHGHFEDEGWRVRKDGSLFWANVVITPLYAKDGSLVGYSKITRDLTERRHHEEVLRQSEERFRLLVEGVKDYAIFLLDVNGRVASWNAGAERINGYRAEEIVGQHFSRFFPAEDRARAERDLALASFEGRTEYEGWRVRKDGTRFWAATVLTALPGPDGTVRGFAKLTRDLTATRRIEALEEAGRRMSEFLAMLSHELRNPLAPIRNAVHVMHMKRLEDPELRWSRDVIERQVSHLTRLVDDLLDVTRITSGKIRLNVEPLEISVVVGRAVEASRPLLDAKGHRLDVLLPNTPLIVRGDLTRLTQVVLNILNNASKFTPEGGWIRVSAAREGNEAVLRIRDNGAGIPPSMQAHVFDLFAQGAQPLDRAAGGLGIGLTLVKRLVSMHHGHVEVVSEGPGRGSEFVIRLPLVRGMAELSADSAEATLGAAGSRRVLVVDDNRDAAESLAMLLQMVGHDVRVAGDGPTALATAAEFRPDLVLLDIGLPGMSGYEVAGRLRAVCSKDRLVIAAVTGYGQDEDRLRAHAAGFDHHLTKPVDFARLQSVIEGLPAEKSRGA